MKKSIIDVAAFVTVFITRYAQLLAYIMMATAALKGMTAIIRLFNKILIKLGGNENDRSRR